MRNTLIILASLILLCSCEEELDISLTQKEKKIVINSFFNDNELIHVNISANQPATDKDTILFIDNACVLLYANDIFLDTLTFKGEGYYYSDEVIPEAGMSYNLRVEVPGMTTATTDYSQIPVVVKGFLLDTSSFIDKISDKEIREVILRFKDIENTTNYYLLHIMWEGTWYEYDADSNIVDTVKRKVSYGGGQGINIPASGKFLFTDELFEGDTIEKTLYFRKNLYGSGLEGSENVKAWFKLCTVSEEYYLYGKSCAEQNNSIDWSIFVEPVTVYSNVNNGVGIFAGYGYCIDSLYYEQ